MFSLSAEQTDGISFILRPTFINSANLPAGEKMLSICYRDDDGARVHSHVTGIKYFNLPDLLIGKNQTDELFILIPVPGLISDGRL